MTAAAIPTMAADYEFGGTNPGTFGNPTSTEPEPTVVGSIDESSNINRSKDSATAPPPFGSPSSNTPGTGDLLTPNISGMPAGGYSNNSNDNASAVSYSDINYGNTYNNISTATINGNTGSEIINYPDSPFASETISQIDTSYSVNKFTLPDGLYYDDGSIGTLSIPKFNLSVKVYEEESLENLKKGVGHFKSTSCWDGNVGFAGHNRGVTNNFGQIHTLTAGDKIIYTTKMGTRTYEVYYVGKINETDSSRIERTNENIVTLITCVNDVPELRWCVQAISLEP